MQYYYNTKAITYVKVSGGGETVSDCVGSSCSPESTHTLQFAAMCHMFPYLAGIKIDIAVHVTQRASETASLILYRWIQG